MTEQVARLLSKLAVREVSTDVLARLGAAYEAFECLAPVLEAGPMFAGSVMAAGAAQGQYSGGGNRC